MNTVRIKTSRSAGLFLEHKFHTNAEALDYLTDLEDAKIRIIKVIGLPFVEDGDLK